jgi:spore maturation protein CgeB
MKLIIFGLTISSSWGNGHATIWRGLCRALARRGHEVTFFEQDVSYYSRHRDLTEMPGVTICLYPDWNSIEPLVREKLSQSDMAVVTSYCPDGVAATNVMLEHCSLIRVFYDMDTPVTLQRLDRGEKVPYLGPRRFRDFDLVLSYTGGAVLDRLKRRYGAKRVSPLYGCADPEVHVPVPVNETYRADLSYLGTFAEDRQSILNELLIQASNELPEKRFLIGGALYPEDFPWRENIWFIRHVPPSEHPQFYCSSFFTLNITRKIMSQYGYCPSGRLFEAAACGVPVITDWWEGLDSFFDPASEIIVAKNTRAVVHALTMSQAEREEIARAARKRILSDHTAEQRVKELERILMSC